jgi:ribonuclease HI
MIKNINENDLIVFTDGGSRGNPGPAASGVVIKDHQNKDLICFGKYLGHTTNNVAEYQGVIEALSWLINNPIGGTKERKIYFYLDSKLVVSQLSGLYKIKDLKLKSLVIKIKELEEKIGSKIFYNFVPRFENYQADSLVNQTLNKEKY